MLREISCCGRQLHVRLSDVSDPRSHRSLSYPRSPYSPRPHWQGVAAGAHRSYLHCPAIQRGSRGYTRSKRLVAEICFAALQDSAEEVEHEIEGDYCIPPEIATDNTSHPEFSLVTIEVKDYPGLFRVVAWVLNGLQLDVHNAVLSTDADGIAKQTFWLTDLPGAKLSDRQLEEVVDRLTSFVVFCKPAESASAATKFSYGPVTVDNSIDDELSVITIFAASRRHQRLPRNALLEIASCINGIGVIIRRAVIQSCTDCGVSIDEEEFPEARKSGARLYKIYGTTRSGMKLDHGHATALLYTFGLVFGEDSKHGPLTAPHYELD